MLELTPCFQILAKQDTNSSREKLALTRTPKKRIRARRFRAASLYVPRADFNPVAIGIETMATGLGKKKSPALPVDVVSAVRSQRDRAAKAIHVTVVVSTMHSGRYWQITQQARK